MRRMCARPFLVKRAQEKELNEVIDAMKTKKLTFKQAVQKKPSKDRASHLIAMFKYVQFLDADGLSRIRGRLQNSDLDFNFKHPVLLSHRHWVTD